MYLKDYKVKSEGLGKIMKPFFYVMSPLVINLVEGEHGKIVSDQEKKKKASPNEFLVASRGHWNYWGCDAVVSKQIVVALGLFWTNPNS